MSVQFLWKLFLNSEYKTVLIPFFLSSFLSYSSPLPLICLFTFGLFLFASFLPSLYLFIYFSLLPSRTSLHTSFPSFLISLYFPDSFLSFFFGLFIYLFISLSSLPFYLPSCASGILSFSFLSSFSLLIRFIYSFVWLFTSLHFPT